MRIPPMLGFAAFIVGASVSFAQAPSPTPTGDTRAVVGNGSQGGGGSRRTGSGIAMERAMTLAKESGRQSPTIEQLLLALLDDGDVQNALASQYVDATSLRATLTQYVERQPRIEPTVADPLGRDPKLTPVLMRSMMKGVADNRQPVATDLLTAILVEGNSFAAQTLADHGLTVQEAANAAVEHYLASQKEAQERFAEAQRTAAAAAERPTVGFQNRIVESRQSGGPVAARNYTLKITSGGSTAVRFKAAVSHDGVLDLYVESTPFETKFSARQVVALYEGFDRGTLKAELFADVDGVVQKVGGGSGSEAGAIFEDLYQRADQRSGRLR